MKKTRNITLLVVMVVIAAASLVAFRPFGGDADENGVSDFTEALAAALGVNVDTLQAAQETAHENALNQAVADGLITQEQADAMLAGEFAGKPIHFKASKLELDSYLADALNISVEELQVAEDEARITLLDQALEDGSITQEEYDQIKLGSSMRPYLDEAFSSAYQSAIDAALADGAITEDQAAQLLAEPMFGMPGLGGGRMHGGMPHGFEGRPFDGE